MKWTLFQLIFHIYILTEESQSLPVTKQTENIPGTPTRETVMQSTTADSETSARSQTTGSMTITTDESAIISANASGGKNNFGQPTAIALGVLILVIVILIVVVGSIIAYKNKLSRGHEKKGIYINFNGMRSKMLSRYIN